MPTLMFPSVGTQVLSSLIHFLGVSVLSHCLSRRIAAESLTTLEGLRSLTWPRVCVILVFIDSWLFLFTSGVLIFGVGLELHSSVCSAGILTCIVFYATSKLLIYAYLIERVYIVWTPATSQKRFQSPIYLLCFATVCAYGVVIMLLFFGRQDRIRHEDSVCLIGLRRISSYPLLIYDLYINVFLTSLFLFPLLRATTVNQRAKRIAKRALLAATVALTTSTANIAILAILGGVELGWLCLGSCGLDIIVNALSLFWVTNRGRRPRVTTIEAEHKSDPPHLRSILKTPTIPPLPEAYSPTSSRYTCGPHPILNAYYHCKNVSVVSTSSGAVSASERRQSPYIQDPTHPFPRASYVPKTPEPEVRITANRDHDVRHDSPSTVHSLAGFFHNGPVAEEMPEDIQITVTTDVEIESVDIGSVYLDSERGHDHAVERDPVSLHRSLGNDVSASHSFSSLSFV